MGRNVVGYSIYGSGSFRHDPNITERHDLDKTDIGDNKLSDRRSLVGDPIRSSGRFRHDPNITEWRDVDNADIRDNE